jgi:hypothetical protein
MRKGLRITVRRRRTGADVIPDTGMAAPEA